MIRPRNAWKATLLIWIRSVLNQSCGHPNSPDYLLRDLVTGGITGEGVNVHENESVRCKPMQKSFWQRALTLSVDHASDAMIDCVPETTHRVLDGGSLLHRIPWQHGTRLWKYSERLRGRVDHQRRHASQKRTQYTCRCQLHCWDRFIRQERRVLEKLISDELRERVCHAVNEQIWWCDNAI